MGTDLIPLLQMGIWLIVAIMIGMVALYFYLMKPSNAKKIIIQIVIYIIKTNMMKIR